MKFLIQVVNNASVDIDGETVGKIDRGLLILSVYAVQIPKKLPIK